MTAPGTRRQRRSHLIGQAVLTAAPLALACYLVFALAGVPVPGWQ